MLKKKCEKKDAMKKYIIAYRLYKEKVDQELFHAGGKAVEDVYKFALKEGYEPLFIVQYKNSNSIFVKILNRFFSLFSWLRVVKRIKRGDCVFMQGPDSRRQLGSNWGHKTISRKAHVIFLVHDIESIRTPGNKKAIRDERFIRKFSQVLIVHNEKMKQYCIEQGVADKSLISLQIFDYYCEGDPMAQGEGVAVAGNLDRNKSPYVYLLDKLGIKLELFGPNYSGGQKGGVRYNGAVPADVLPNVLKGRFGLIWDGNAVDTCSGATGNYLRYNNPHKTSLYLCAGIPVIIWEEAAMAQLILKYNLGFTVNSLYDIQLRLATLTDTEYDQMKQSAKEMSRKLRHGYFTSLAIKEAEKRVMEGL